GRRGEAGAAGADEHHHAAAAARLPARSTLGRRRAAGGGARARPGERARRQAPADRAGVVTTVPGDLAAALAGLVGAHHVRAAPAERLAYAMDGLPTHRRLPRLAVLPGTRDEVVAVVRLLADLGVPFVPRGAGTGLSGGALADHDAVLLVLTRLNRILKIDVANRCAVVEPGVVNARLSAATAPHGLHYAPDPSSQTACTLGGNVAENAGGPHCLKYGVTTSHILALEVVRGDGRVVTLGSAGGEPWGPDGRNESAVEEEAQQVAGLRTGQGARQVRQAADAKERERLWQGRKKAFGAMGRLSRDLVVQDAVVPRSSLPVVLETIAAIAA